MSKRAKRKSRPLAAPHLPHPFRAVGTLVVFFIRLNAVVTLIVFFIRLKEMLKDKLVECGWRDELREHCKGA